jgi:hypothetical protein
VSGASWTVAPNGGAFAVTNAGLTNIDVALSTRLKPADTLAGVTTVAAVTTITNPVAVTQSGTWGVNDKPSDQYGNYQSAEDNYNWQLAVLDEMRAIRIGIQHLLQYMSPDSGNPTMNISPIPGISVSSRMGGEEVDIYFAARSLRDSDSDEALQ